MRTVGWLVAVLIAAGWLASEIPAISTGQSDTQRTPWRRTRDGWQYASWLATAGPVEPAQFHPGLLALVEISLSVWALKRLPKKRRPNATPRSFSPGTRARRPKSSRAGHGSTELAEVKCPG